MSVDLSTYGGQLRDPGYEGGLVDMNVYQSQSKTNNGTLPIQFGRAVARLGDDGCQAIVTDDMVPYGLSLRLLALHASLLPTDTSFYQPTDEVAVMTDGLAFAIPVENVTAGDRVVVVVTPDGVSKLGSAQNGAGGTPAEAMGTVVFTGVGTVGDTVTINGVVFTAIAAGATPANTGQFALGTTAATTAANLLAAARTNNSAGVTVLNFSLTGATITVSANAPGTAGNAYTLAKTSTAVTVSGATLTGGAAATTGLGTGRVIFGTSTWESTAVAGNLARIKVRVTGYYLNS
jgi:hypothetical protein